MHTRHGARNRDAGWVCIVPRAARSARVRAPAVSNRPRVKATR